MLEGEPAAQYAILHRDGLAANKAGEFAVGIGFFQEAYELANEANDPCKQLDALNPLARAQWGAGNFGAAQADLATAAVIAEQAQLPDEQGIVRSNQGRLAIAEAMSMSASQQKQQITEQALPEFEGAATLLVGHPHIYFTYENASHGAVVAALVGRRKLAYEFIKTGLHIAFRQSEAPYDTGKRPVVINPRGLGRFIVAAALLPLADATPVLTTYVRNKLRG